VLKIHADVFAIWSLPEPKTTILVTTNFLSRFEYSKILMVINTKFLLEKIKIFFVMTFTDTEQHLRVCLNV